MQIDQRLPRRAQRKAGKVPAEPAAPLGARGPRPLLRRADGGLDELLHLACFQALRALQALAAEQLRHAHAEGAGERHEQRHIGHRLAGLPFADGLVGDGEARRQFALREPQRAAAPGDELAGLLFVKAVHALTSPSF